MSELNLNTNQNESDFDELADLFGQGSDELAEAENVVLTQNLEGFASCFPDWDLHPPVAQK